MNNKMPRTPFSTALSGSAKETEIRLKNIFSGPKKRPPVLFLALMFSVCIFCGNLVSCNVAEAETPDASGSVLDSPDSSASVAVGPDEGTAFSPRPNGWQTAELKNSISPSCFLDLPYEICPICREPLGEHGPETCDHVLDSNLPAEELPREAVSPGYAQRKDYWRDMLLPVAYDPETDFTVYFVVVPDSMPDIEPESSPDLYSLKRAGLLLRLRDQVGYFEWNWDINAKFGFNPLLVVDDFDGDSCPEAALSLAWGEGTGCYTESLYIIELDWGAMVYNLPDYSDIPLEITVRPDGNAAEVTSGDKTLPVDLTRLGVPFPGRVEVGNQVQFKYEDGQIFCELALDFSCYTLGYLSSAEFPIVYQDGAYRLGPAAHLRDVLYFGD